MSEDQAKLIVMVVGCILVALGFLTICVWEVVKEALARKELKKKEEEDKKDE